MNISHSVKMPRGRVPTDPEKLEKYIKDLAKSNKITIDEAEVFLANRTKGKPVVAASKKDAIPPALLMPKVGSGLTFIEIQETELLNPTKLNVAHIVGISSLDGNAMLAISTGADITIQETEEAFVARLNASVIALPAITLVQNPESITA